MPVYIPPPNKSANASSETASGVYLKTEADSRFVHNFGSEIINGSKIFISSPIFNDGITLIGYNPNELLSVDISGTLTSTGYQASDFALKITTNDISAKLTLETADRAYYDNYLQQQINQVSSAQYLIFSEPFTGNGITNQFNLTGNITNAQFISGGWNSINVQNALNAEIANLNGGPIYDAGLLSIFTRHRINVLSITGNGIVNLDYIPQNGEIGNIWYWYTLNDFDRVDHYYRSDIVTKMEETIGELATATAVNTISFENILSPFDDTVQRALDTIDDKAILKSDVVSISGNLVSFTNSTSANAYKHSIVYSNTLSQNLSAYIISVSGSLETQIRSLSACEIAYTPSSSANWYNVQQPKNLQQAEDSLAKTLFFTRHTANRTASTGLAFGGDLVGTIGTSAFSISGGYGYIIDQTIEDSSGLNPLIAHVSWSSFSDISITPFISAGYSATYVMITSAGNYKLKSVEPNSQDIRDNIYLGKVSHRFGSLNSLRSYKRLPEEVYANISDINDALGPLNLSGNIYSSANNTLTIQKSAGTSYRFSSNSINNTKSPSITNDPEINPISFRPTYRKNILTGGVSYLSSTANVDPNRYDDGTGILQNVPNNDWTIQRIYFFPVTNSTYIFYGQTTYSSLAAAKAGTTSENFILPDPDNSFTSATFRGWLVVRQGETNLASSNTLFINAGKFGSTAGGGGSLSSILSADYITFNTNNVTPPVDEGTLYYDNVNKTLAIQTDIPGTVLQIGEESWIRVLNNTTSTILNGSVVYSNGSQSDHPTILLAQANSEITSDSTLGVATSDILPGDYGYITTFGLVRSLDTSLFVEGAIVYLSDTNAGKFTNIPVIAPGHLVTIGQIIRSHPTQGILLVSLNVGYELNELHDVYNSHILEDGQLLTYTASGGRWENSTNIYNYTPISVTRDISSSLVSLSKSTSANSYSQSVVYTNLVSGNNTAFTSSISANLQNQIISLVAVTGNFVTFNNHEIINGQKTFTNPITLTNGTTAQFFTSIVTQPASFDNIIIDKFYISAFNGCNWDVIIKDSSNLRMCNVMAGWIGGNVTFTETNAPDIGDTSPVNLSVALISGGEYVALQATAIGSSNWTIKSLRKCL